jgi:Mce-associated membrane protein
MTIAKPAHPLLAVAAILALVAAGCAAWFGSSWYRAAHSGSLADSRTRDAVLQAAEQGVLNFNTLNYHHAAQGLELWLSSSTGTLHTQLAQSLQEETQLVEQRKTITTARILDGAVTQMDTAGGTASFMVAVDVTVTPASGSPFTESESEVGQLNDTASGWKLSALGYPSGSASPSASPSPSAPASPSASRSAGPSTRPSS